MNVLRHSNFCPDRLLAKDRAHSDQQKMSRWIESPESVPTIRFSVSRSSNEHPRSPPATLKTFGQVRVHVLYKRAEIPANTMIPAFAVSVTIGNRRRRRIRVRPPLALPNYLESSACKMRVQGLPLRRSVTERPGRDSRSNGARRLELWQSSGSSRCWTHLEGNLAVKGMANVHSRSESQFDRCFRLVFVRSSLNC